jgi:hypothetical protein
MIFLPMLFEFGVVIFGAFLIPPSVCDCRIAGEVGKRHQCFEKEREPNWNIPMLTFFLTIYQCLLDLT